LLPFVGRDAVNLVEDDQDFIHVGSYRFDEGQFLARDRRIRANNKNGGIDLWYEVLRGCCVSREDRSYSRRMNQARAAGEERRRKKNLDAGNLLRVFWIPSF
jgi:hypothetical protein